MSSKQDVPEMVPIEENVEDGKSLYLLGSGYSVLSWRPGPAGSGEPSTQVHVVVSIPDTDIKMVMRLKSARALDEFVGILLNHRRDVWGGSNT